MHQGLKHFFNLRNLIIAPLVVIAALLTAFCTKVDNTKTEISVEAENELSELTPVEVFKAYASELQNTKKLVDFPFDKYLSARALKVQQENMSKMGISADIDIKINDQPIEDTDKEVTVEVNPELQKKGAVAALVLNMLKKETENFPEPMGEAVISGSKATYEYTLENYPDDQSDFKALVSFVNESGWKIDMLENKQTFKDGNGSFESSTYK